jgi:predicted glutamine amidotransferase
MCRLLGIVSSEPTQFTICLKEAPRSMAALSEEHRDGWGIAVHHDPTASRRSGAALGWTIHKGIERAGSDQRFHELAVGARGEMVVAHIRKRTVGRTSHANTHPFQRGRWVFAHNGTIHDCDYLRSRSSPARLAEVGGETDSELFFAFLLTRLDQAGLTDSPATPDMDGVVRDATREVCERPNAGALNYLLSDGQTLYAHRFGRTLALLERSPEDPIMEVRSSRDGTLLKTPWSRRRHAILIASEHMTPEPWQAIDEGMLLRVDRVPTPRWRLVAAGIGAATAASATATPPPR